MSHTRYDPKNYSLKYRRGPSPIKWSGGRSCNRELEQRKKKKERSTVGIGALDPTKNKIESSSLA